jgi:hypothetical protein
MQENEILKDLSVQYNINMHQNKLTNTYTINIYSDAKHSPKMKELDQINKKKHFE